MIDKKDIKVIVIPNPHHNRVRVILEHKDTGIITNQLFPGSLDEGKRLGIKMVKDILDKEMEDNDESFANN